MKMVKSLILGSAAGLVAMSGAQAADLPVKAKAVEYVKVCSLYGAGFYYIPGTDTCIKLSGYLRVDLGGNSGNSVFTGNYAAPGGYGDRLSNAFSWRSREDFDIDTRTATEYGVVRTFFDATFTWTDDVYTQNGTNANGTVYSQIGALGAGQSNNGTSTVASGTVGVYYAFIQFAGFTIGKAVSPFSPPWTNYPGNNFDGLVGGGGTVTGVNQFVYTAQFGNGWSGTIGFQDPTTYYQAGNVNFSGVGSTPALAVIGAGFGTNDVGGTVFPDIVANIQVTQAWGMFQLSAAAHDNHPAYYVNSSVPFGHPDDKWGFAVQASGTVNLPMLGPGDVINADLVYTDGATRYNIQDLASGAGAWTTFKGGASVPGALGTVGFGNAPDSVFAFGGGQQLISTWGGRGGYTHNWNPYWNTSIYGAYADIHYSSGAAAIVCASVAISTPTITTCNPNYSVAQLGTVTRWTPVKNLTFSGEFVYSHLEQKYAGTIAENGSYGTGAYQIGNQDTYQVLLRAQRNW